jgi:hypothetical protein
MIFTMKFGVYYMQDRFAILHCRIFYHFMFPLNTYGLKHMKLLGGNNGKLKILIDITFLISDAV